MIPPENSNFLHRVRGRKRRIYCGQTVFTERRITMLKHKVNKKQLFILTLAVMLIFSMMPSMAFAADTLSSVTDSATGLTISVSEGIEKLNINADTSHGTNYVISSTEAGYFPGSFSLMFNNGTGVSVTCPDTQVHFEFMPPVSDGYGCVSMGTSSCVLTVTKAGAGSCTIYCPAPVGNDPAGSGIVAYGPASAQFVNEGVTTGGWGDAFTSANNGGVKAMVNATAGTGISLGSFGGYTVLDFGIPEKDASGNVISGVYNDPTNKYGVDFILYGNAFNNWAEPGCVQVSLNGSDWYDIAGSLHYRKPVYDTNNPDKVNSSGCYWSYEATYTNPTPADDTISPAAPNLGTGNKPFPYVYTSVLRPGYNATTGTGSVVYNPWHSHSWYPLYCNYFADRTTANTPINLRGHELANLSITSNFGTVYTPYVPATGAASTFKVKGVRLEPVSVGSNNIGSTANDEFLFGYADSHGNGTPSGSQVNPYTMGRTAGGDPIDISWAVYPYGSNMAGRPKQLDCIRYVRVYTGVQQMNGAMGESSTEITGAYRATGTGSGAAQIIPFIGRPRPGQSPYPLTHSNLGTCTVYTNSGQYNLVINSTASKLFVNGEEKNGVVNMQVTAETGKPAYVQVITQDGTGSPYITLIKVLKR